eukprot:gnl/Chilomastix_caulleri/4591.p2 GENE.gnl/Chilomastix_caulleri/4591~~gnl/Chilomastix_caulleri/4591.p2  ORF type:complete len:78 (-),score=8.56 gnl/Chilomastix_caulleri/4591:40-273(-)
MKILNKAINRRITAAISQTMPTEQYCVNHRNSTTGAVLGIQKYIRDRSKFIISVDFVNAFNSFGTPFNYSQLEVTKC